MKKWLVLVLAAMLLAVMPLAMAENVWDVEAREMNFNKIGNGIALRLPDSNYFRLVRADGTVVVDESTCYTGMTAVYDQPFFEVEVESADGVHNTGLIDGDGRVLVPAEYADIEVVSAKWQAGVKLVPSSAEEKDYTYSNWSTGEKKFFRIDTVDFYFEGQKAGTLARADYSSSISAYGNYICVTNTARERIFYNSKMEKSPYEAEYSGEYDEVYKNRAYTYYHQGTGQQAFVPGCTLTADEVEQAYMYEAGKILDLQGNVVATCKEYDIVRDFSGEYTLVREDKMYGLMDLQGNEVIPLEYDELSNYEDELLKYGYISAVKDGKFGFLDAQGNVTCEFKYAKDAVSNRGTFATIKNLDGTIIVLSAAAGELPEHYADVTMPSYEGSLAFVAENEAGEYSVVDLYGNTLLPFSGDWRYINLGQDGTVAVVSLGSRQYKVYQFDGQAQPAAQQPQAGGLLGSLTPVEVQPVDDGSWTCENGHGGNTAKFCGECGAKKPEEKPAACTGCGYAFGESTPKFCPECGQAVAQ
ncbi:MAG: WG repeat-containing protein [Clostridia bacterium]|nr:WG repeat-containing protein [Clostridia bacterium]